jgi:hypothetical protein
MAVECVAKVNMEIISKKLRWKEMYEYIHEAASHGMKLWKAFISSDKN